VKESTLADLLGSDVLSAATERPQWLFRMLAENPELSKAWRGLLKNVTECDRVVIAMLIQAGRTNPEILDALRWRPIRYHLDPGDPQLLRQMAALAKEIENERQRISRSVVVQHIVIYDGDPPRYEVTVQGKQVTLTSQELLSPALFRRRVMELCHILPDVPRKQAEWDEMVRGWLETAEHRELGTTDWSYVRDEIASIIQQWPIMEAADAHVSDLRRGVVIRDTDAGLDLVHLTPLRRELRGDGNQIGPQDLAVQMRELGWKADIKYVGSQQVRCWGRSITREGGSSG
jgi:hypothetical protein